MMESAVSIHNVTKSYNGKAVLYAIHNEIFIATLQPDTRSVLQGITVHI